MEPHDLCSPEAWAAAVDNFVLDKGGIHKRARKPSHDRSGPRSKLGSFLIEEFCFGRFSATQVQRLAACAVEDGSTHPELCKLASMGAQGDHTGNCWRDLIRYIKSLVEVPLPVGGNIPLMITKGVSSGPDKLIQYYNLPHVWFNHLYRNHKAEFQLRMGATSHQLTKFWNCIKANDPRRQNNIILDRANLRNNGIPIGIHGDGVECSNDMSLECVQWFGLLGDGPTIDRYWFTGGYFNKTAVHEVDNFEGGKTTKKNFGRY